MENQVVETPSVADLQTHVQDLINQAWVPQGGISVATYGAGSWWYYQAIAKSMDRLLVPGLQESS